MPSNNFASVDARRALKLYEISCVLLRLRVEKFCGRCAEPVGVSCQSEVTVDTLVSLLQRRRVRQPERQPCKYFLERLDVRTVLYVLHCARPIDKTSWTH